MLRTTAVTLVVFLLTGPAHARDRRGDLSLQASVRPLRELDATDVGLGARVSYRLNRWLAADGEASLFPRDAGSPVFSRFRLEGLVGLRGGPHLGRTGGYLALRAGAVRFSEAPGPFPCILIFPPPLQCAIAVGDTVPSVQANAGFEAYPRERVVVRVEVGDQLLRYPGPAFWSHNFKAAVSVGLRF